MKKYLGIMFLVLMISCKTKAIVESKTVANSTLSSEKIIENHYNNKKDFSTLYIKANAKYKDESQSQSVTAEIRIKKNESILVSVRFLGITMAKALITPDKVQYYEKIDGKYFEGDYQSLSQWLGTDLDYYKVQNLFVGQAMDDLKKDKYSNSIEDKMYKLENQISDKTHKAFYFDTDNFFVVKQMINQTDRQRMLQVIYPSFKQYTEASLPGSILIETTQEKGKNNISIDYNTVSFNEELTFPYNVPEGYERIFIN